MLPPFPHLLLKIATAFKSTPMISKTAYKLGASYSVWDGEEMLEYAIRSIRSEVDYVNVVWQKVSWFGSPCSDGLEPMLKKLRDEKLIDELIFFEPDLSALPAENETGKRNVGLEAARKAGCTHFITLDTDELFDAEEFKTSKEIIYQFGLTHTACPIITYFSPTVRIVGGKTGCTLPFICSIEKGEKLVLNAHQPWYADPTRKIPVSKNSRPFFMHTVCMHHFPRCRHDLNKKIQNSTMNQSAEGRENLKAFLNLDPEKMLEDGFCVKTSNKFGLPF